MDDLLKQIEGPGIGVSVGVAVFMVLNLALGRDILPRVEQYDPIVPPVLDMDPASLYANNCQQCHQADGRGLPGQYPPLAGSSWLTRDPETPIRILTLGLQGDIEVNGQTFNNVMPAQGHLTDEKVALVLTYARTNFGNTAPAVEPDTVSTVRTELSTRSTPWNGGAELQSVRY
jgi:hypothetical protein